MSIQSPFVLGELVGIHVVIWHGGFPCMYELLVPLDQVLLTEVGHHRLFFADIVLPLAIMQLAAS